MLDAYSSDWLVLEKEIEEGATIGSLLTDIAIGNADFRKGVFDPDVGQVNSLVNIFLNDSHLQFSGVAEVKLNDGDILMLLPLYAGG